MGEEEEEHEEDEEMKEEKESLNQSRYICIYILIDICRCIYTVVFIKILVLDVRSW